MEIHAYRYGMRPRPHDLHPQPKDGFVCVGKGGTVDGFRYHSFVYCINGLDGEVAERYGPDCLGATYLKAEGR